MLHELKCWPEPFAAVASGEKSYEIRRADRPFKVGDKIILRKWDPRTRRYSGAKIFGSITHITNGGTWGVPVDLCVLGIRTWTQLIELRRAVCPRRANCGEGIKDRAALASRLAHVTQRPRDITKAIVLMRRQRSRERARERRLAQERVERERFFLDL